MRSTNGTAESGARPCARPAPATPDERGARTMTSNPATELARLVAGGEGVDVEFKRSLTKDVGRGLCAFANAGGGTVLLGVSDAGKIVGVADHNRLKARVLSTARSADPPIAVEAESLGDVLRVVVPPQKRKPYSFGGRFFMPRRSEQSATVERGGRRAVLRGWPTSLRQEALSGLFHRQQSRRRDLGAVQPPRQDPGVDGSHGRAPKPRVAGQRRPNDPRRGVAPGP